MVNLTGELLEMLLVRGISAATFIDPIGNHHKLLAVRVLAFRMLNPVVKQHLVNRARVVRLPHTLVMCGARRQRSELVRLA